MAQNRESALKIRGRAASQSLLESWISLVKQTILAPYRAVLSFSRSAVRTAAPPLLPLFALASSAPLLALISFFVGSYVWRSGAVSWKTSMDLQYGDGAPPYAERVLPLMSPVEPYDVFLHLTIPATQANYDLGNFMTSLSLNTSKTKPLVSVRKPAIILPPRSSILFSKPKVASLTVPLLKEFVSGSTKVIARVELGRRDYWKSLGSGQGREVSVISISLEGVLKHKGIRGLVSKYPLLAAILSASSFFIVSFATLATFLVPAVLWRYNEHEVSKAEIELSSLPPGLVDDKIRRKKPFKRNASRGFDGVKVEPADVPTPSASKPNNPLRRRRSRLSDRSSDED